MRRRRRHRYRAHAFARQTSEHERLARKLAVSLSDATHTVGLETAEFVLRDVVGKRSLSALTDAYAPRHYYWEVLEMARKLALVGMVLLVCLTGRRAMGLFDECEEE